MQIRAGTQETGDREKLLFTSSDRTVTFNVNDDGLDGATAEVDLSAATAGFIGQPSFVQDTQPTYVGKYVWWQTNAGGAGNLTLYIEDGT